MTDAAEMGEYDDRTTMRREMDRIVQQRLVHLDSRIEDLDDKIRHELESMEVRLKERMDSCEEIMMQKTANAAIKMTFNHLGVDVDSPVDLERFRNDLRFSGMVRESMVKSFFAIVAAICGVIGVSVAMFFKAKLGVQ